MESIQGFVFVPIAAVIAVIYTWMTTDVADENRFKEVIKNVILVSVLVAIAVMVNTNGLPTGVIDEFNVGPAE